MMRRWFYLALLAALALGISGCASSEPGYYPPPPHYTDVPDDISYFHDDLAPYGNWYAVEPYGWVWCPRGMSYGWRPYMDGHWIYTDYGWMWASDYSWGWAPFHYGRWAYDSFYGWIWVPGDTWAPSWVAWRYGDGWIGWAPLPPEVGWRVGVGLDSGSFDLNVGIESSRWSFVEQRYFLDQKIRTRVLPRSRNVTLFRMTRNITKYGEVRSRPAERGLDADMIGRAVGRMVPRYEVIEGKAKAPKPGRFEVIRGRSVEIYRPAVPQGQPEARKRIEPPPPEKPAPPQEIEKQQESDRRRLEDRLEKERKTLQREQEKELRKPPPSVPEKELRTRQEEESRAQHEIEKRERERLEKQQERQRKDLEQPEPTEQRERPEKPAKGEKPEKPQQRDSSEGRSR